MAVIPEQQVLDALTTLSHAFADGRVPHSSAGPDGVPVEAENSPMLAAASPELREALGEASLAVAFGAFAARGGYEGPMHVLVAGMGLLAMLGGEEPDPPAEIVSVVAEGEHVEAEIDRAGEHLDERFGRDAAPGDVTAALEARILGNAIMLAGCTITEVETDQPAVRLRAARTLVKLAAGLLTMNLVPAPATSEPEAPPDPATPRT